VGAGVSLRVAPWTGADEGRPANCMVDESLGRCLQFDVVLGPDNDDAPPAHAGTRDALVRLRRQLVRRNRVARGPPKAGRGRLYRLGCGRPHRQLSPARNRVSLRCAIKMALT